MDKIPLRTGVTREHGKQRTTSESSVRPAAMDSLLVLDVWPIMQWFRRKYPGEAAFSTLLEQASLGEAELCIGRINLGEVFYIAAKEYGESVAQALVEALTAIPVLVVTPTGEDMDAAAHVKARYPISYADAFAVVLSRQRSAPLVSGDPDLRPLEQAGILRLHWLGA